MQVLLLQSYYFLAWARNFPPGRKQFREHTCYSKPFSPGRNAVTWANYAENITYQKFYASFTTTELLHVSDD